MKGWKRNLPALGAGCRNFFRVMVVIYANDEPINKIGQTYRRYV